MRSGPLIAIALGSVALIAGSIGAYRTVIPPKANHSWGDVGERMHGQAAPAATSVDPAYAAQQRRFGWGACAGLGAMAIALGIAAARSSKPKQ